MQFTDSTWLTFANRRGTYLHERIAELEQQQKEHPDPSQAHLFDDKGQMKREAKLALRFEAETSIRTGMEYALDNLRNANYREAIEAREGKPVTELDAATLFKYAYFGHHEGTGAAPVAVKIQLGTATAQERVRFLGGSGSNKFTANVGPHAGQYLSRAGFTADDLTPSRQAHFAQLDATASDAELKQNEARAREVTAEEGKKTADANVKLARAEAATAKTALRKARDQAAAIDRSLGTVKAAESRAQKSVTDTKRTFEAAQKRRATAQPKAIEQAERELIRATAAHEEAKKSLAVAQGQKEELTKQRKALMDEATRVDLEARKAVTDREKEQRTAKSALTRAKAQTASAGQTASVARRKADTYLYSWGSMTEANREKFNTAYVDWLNDYAEGRADWFD